MPCHLGHVRRSAEFTSGGAVLFRFAISWISHHSFRYCDFYPLTFRPFTFRTRLPAVDTAARFVTGRRRWADFIIEGPGVL